MGNPALKTFGKIDVYETLGLARVLRPTSQVSKLLRTTEAPEKAVEGCAAHGPDMCMLRTKKLLAG